MHIRELSSMRGIAAIIVMFGHSFSLIDRHVGGAKDSFQTQFFDFFGKTFNGPAAVQMFFVLSGLVLSLSLERRSDDPLQWTSSFYIRRIFRIYPALWVSLLLALSLLQLERSACSSGLCTSHLRLQYQEDFTIKDIVLSFMGIFTGLNGPMWSLRVELVCSFFFPAIFICLRNKTIQVKSFVLFVALAALPVPDAWFFLAFALGSSIPLLKIKANFPFWIVCLLALIILVFSRQLLQPFNFDRKTHDIIDMFASFAIIYPIFHKLIDIEFLRNRVLFYLGEISYSIYILHFPILYALLYILTTIVGRQLIVDLPIFYNVVLSVMTFVVVISVSALSFRYIEIPFQKFGRVVSDRLSLSCANKAKTLFSK